MKLFILSILLFGCASERDYSVVTEQVVNIGMEKIVDKSTGVVCFIYKDSDGVSNSCLKVYKPKSN